AYVYHSSSSECAAFLSNYDTENVVKVFFNNRHYKLHPKSISILANCQDVIFNTAVVGVQTSHMRMISSGIEFSGWESFNEDLTSSDGSSTFTARGLMEQIDVTNDYTDYLWYTT
ncbi:Beta-galactosidase 3, partial [Striga hermonthica]